MQSDAKTVVYHFAFGDGAICLARPAPHRTRRLWALDGFKPDDCFACIEQIGAERSVMSEIVEWFEQRMTERGIK